ncbi:MAG TPA: beta-ketoacyl-ACP synthase III [Candidatus Sulfotelmatobacter sp.]|nr:beta-ketoacyl-ACP synthase III [Candidatus Sulfotelmatobacter sp.]
MRTRIIGTGSYLPKKVLSNADLEATLGAGDEWIRTLTGVVTRRIAAPEEAASDLAFEAAQVALADAGITAEELDLILMATITPDTACPSGACWLQSKLGARCAAAFDIVAACSGFVFGLSVAEQYLRTGAARTVLLVAAEVMSRSVNWQDKSTCILWGDGAGAVVLRQEEGEQGILSIHVHTDGTRGESLLLPGGGSRTTPISHESVDADRHTLKMEGQQAFKVAVRCFSDVCQEALKHNNVSVTDLALFVPHQANLRIIQAVAYRLGLPLERVALTIHKYGNMSSATVPITLDEARREARIHPGDLVLLAAFGGGLAWGSALVRW